MPKKPTLFSPTNSDNVKPSDEFYNADVEDIVFTIPQKIKML